MVGLWTVAETRGVAGMETSRINARHSVGDDANALPRPARMVAASVWWPDAAGKPHREVKMRSPDSESRRGDAGDGHVAREPPVVTLATIAGSVGSTRRDATGCAGGDEDMLAGERKPPAAPGVATPPRTWGCRSGEVDDDEPSAAAA
jgi:hypothetical protein